MTSGILSVKVFRTAAELWPALVGQAGLTGTRLGRRGKYDGDLLDDLRARLFPGRIELLDKLFAGSSLSAEELLRAFFATLRPFALMSHDIFEMLSAAEANGSGDALMVRFEFEPGNQLDMLLQDFRRQMETLSVKVSEKRIWKVDYQDLWNLVQGGRMRHAESRAANRITRAGLKLWLNRYESEKVIERIPDDWNTERADVDERLARVVALANQFVAAFHRYGGTTYELLRAAGYDESKRQTLDVTGFTVQGLWHLESNYWLGAVVELLIGCGEHVLAGLTADEAKLAEIMANIDRILPPDVDTTNVTELVRTLEDLLDLPVWKHRYEVYAVWLGAQIFQALKSEGWEFRFHLVEGRLEFAFRGVHLATLTRAEDSTVLIWWTEYETSHANLPSGHRTKAIKPDYRILRAPLSDPAPDVLIVEAKQHLGSSSREFADALKDYAHACPKAGVLLANYGPARETLLDRVGLPWNLRSEAYGRVHPGEQDKVVAFRSDIAKVVGAVLLGNPEVGFTLPAEVRLTWGTKPRDLDLYVWAKDHKRDHGRILQFSQSQRHSMES